MTKTLRKATSTRTRVENKYHCTEESMRVLKHCSTLYQKERKTFYSNSDENVLQIIKEFGK